MQPAQKLTRVLRSLVSLIEDEATKNPDFAQRLEAVMDGFFTSANSKRVPKSKPTETGTPPPDVIAEYQAKGESEFRFWLRELDVPTLKSIVKANGFDPGKNSQRWIEPDKFIALIVDQTASRLRRGSAFLPAKVAETEPPIS